MYLITKGRCNVNIRDQITNRIEYFNVTDLVEGMHFGEIGMMYNSPRSATVGSISYVTCISLTRTKYFQLLMLYPKIKLLFEKYIYDYRDPLKLFLNLKMNRIQYFKTLPKYIKNEIIFNLKFI